MLHLLTGSYALHPFCADCVLLAALFSFFQLRQPVRHNKVLCLPPGDLTGQSDPTSSLSVLRHRRRLLTLRNQYQALAENGVTPASVPWHYISDSAVYTAVRYPSSRQPPAGRLRSRQLKDDVFHCGLPTGEKSQARKPKSAPACCCPESPRKSTPAGASARCPDLMGRNWRRCVLARAVAHLFSRLSILLTSIDFANNSPDTIKMNILFIRIYTGTSPKRTIWYVRNKLRESGGWPSCPN